MSEIFMTEVFSNKVFSLVFKISRREGDVIGSIAISVL